MTFEETVQYLYDLQKFGTKLGLENTRLLCGLLGNPEKGPRFLHVTGTNGKGSVSVLSASAIRAAGYRTGLYTSPHLVSFTERIRLDGVDSTEDEIVALARRLNALLAGNMPELKPTFFEFTTAMAFDYFASKGAEAVVLEVGMGGRLDSTNVVEPLCTVITNVEMEHAEYLGDTVMAVAYEKAGIIKPGVPLVTSETKPDVVDYLEGVCRERGSEMYLLGRDFGYTHAGSSWEGARHVQRFDYEGPGGDIAGIQIPLAGEHQLSNASVAACALGVMSGRGMRIEPDAIRTGFRDVRWEGRLEVVSERPLVVLDGAHNPASVKRLADSIGPVFSGRYERLILVLGVLADKDFKMMYDMLAPFADEVIFTKAAYERAVSPSELMKVAGAGCDPKVAGTVAEALELTMSIAAPADMVLVTGSLYVIGEAKAHIGDRKLFLRA